MRPTQARGDRPRSHVAGSRVAPSPWLLMSDISEVIKKIMDAEKFPDYAIPEKPTGGKSAGEKSRGNELTREDYSYLTITHS